MLVQSPGAPAGPKAYAGRTITQAYILPTNFDKSRRSCTNTASRLYFTARSDTSRPLHCTIPVALPTRYCDSSRTKSMQRINLHIFTHIKLHLDITVQYFLPHPNPSASTLNQPSRKQDRVKNYERHIALF